MVPELLARPGMAATTLQQARAILSALVGAFAIVTIAFIGSSIAALTVSNRIEAEAYDLLGNALPSVTQLMHAMSANHRLNASVQVLSRAPPADPELAGRVATDRAELDSSVATAMTTPDYPGEREFYEEQVRPRLTAVDRAADDLLDTLGRTPSDRRAILTFADGLGSATQELDEPLRSLAELNQGHAYRAAAAVLQSRLNAVRVGLYLDVASAVLAMIATAVLLRAGRRFALRAREEIERETDRARELDTFAQRVAHDLLNPMAGMSFALDSLARRRGDPESSRAVGTARRSLERARRMVEGIYAFSKSGARPEPGATAPLRTVVREAVDDQLSAEAESPPTIEVEPFEDLKVAMDRAVLGVVVSNLLSNAAKYTRDSAVRRITVRARMQGDRMHVEVEDTGPGVPIGMERAVFEPYRRVPGVTQPGLGLGLATVKRIVGAHGGDVGVRRAPKGGSVFWFEVPLGAAPRGQPAPSLGRPSPASR